MRVVVPKATQGWAPMSMDTHAGFAELVPTGADFGRAGDSGLLSMH